MSQSSAPDVHRNSPVAMSRTTRTGVYVFEYEVNFLGDGSAASNHGPTFFVAKDAAWEQQVIIKRKGHPEEVRIGAEDNTDPQSLGGQTSPYTLVVRFEHKEVDAAHGGDYPWFKSGVAFLGNGRTPPDVVTGPSDGQPGNAMWRPQCVVFGAQDDIHNPSNSPNAGFNNLRVWICSNLPATSINASETGPDLAVGRLHLTRK